VERLFLFALGVAVVGLLLWMGGSMAVDSGDLPPPEGVEVGGQEEAAEVGGQEEAAEAAGDDLSQLPPGEGREATITACTGCHGASLVASQRMDRAAWDATITAMQGAQGLVGLSGDARGVVLTYLSAAFGPQEASPADASSPWAEPLYPPNPLW